jgi:exopolyphosphatase/guanosine-5'-triphosphate,3'-diphosphate pyrophosphatase
MSKQEGRLRIAAIDIGSNSIHMVIASAAEASGFEVVDREREVVQVGRGSFKSRELAPEAIRKTVEALQRFVELARRHRVDDILCTATAAVREARNGGDFLAAARRASGIEPKVIPATEEGRLIYLGLKSALNLPPGPLLVVDIGGGSMQLVMGNHERCLKVMSAPLGALRLTEKRLHSDPPRPRELQRLQQQIRKGAREALAAVAKHGPRHVYGSSGSIHALASVAHWMENGVELEQINGHVLTLKSLSRVTRLLKGLTQAEREQLRGIDAKRAEIIVPGAMVLQHVLEEAEADSLTLSDYGVREGLVSDYLQRHAREISILSRIEDLRLRSVLQCLSRFGADVEHPRHVAKLALQLFDGLARAHGLDRDAREILYFAALLHDVGAAIGYNGHGEHSYYIIKNANLRGFSPDQLELIASVARYHGKAKPSKRDPAYAALARKDRERVRWLAAFLRIAERLDRSHYQLVSSLRTRLGRRAVVTVDAGRDAQLEIWAARQHGALLAKLLGKPVAIEWNPKTAGKRAVVGRPRKRTVHRNAEGKGNGTTRAFVRSVQRLRPEAPRS